MMGNTAAGLESSSSSAGCGGSGDLVPGFSHKPCGSGDLAPGFSHRPCGSGDRVPGFYRPACIASHGSQCNCQECSKLASH
eukprot:875084-Amphidinium_carterae.1